MMKKPGTAENRIKKKICSEAGASITFALLLFLVCAALSAVVLVAATTAAGRLKNLAVSDAGYYSVMSAAEYINDQMDGHSVSAIVVNNGEPLFFNKKMNEISEADIDEIADSPLGKETFDNNDDAGDAEGNGSERISAGSIGRGEKSPVKDSFAAVVARLYRTEGTTSGNHTIKFKNNAGSEISAMKVDIEETFDKENGRVYMTVRSADGGSVMLIYLLDAADKYPQVDQVETGNQKRVINSGTEYTWHLVKMTSALDDNGDI